MSANKFNLELHTARLLLEEPFFAAISRVIPKRACDNILTAQLDDKLLNNLLRDLFDVCNSQSFQIEDLPVEETMKSFFANPEKFIPKK